MVKRCHTHVGAPDNRIKALCNKEDVLTPRGKRHDPGTWTRGHRLTASKLSYFYASDNVIFILIGGGRIFPDLYLS
jgi:hypothetical protein